MKNLKALSITFFVFLLPVSFPSAFVLAQSSTKETSEEQEKKQQELERKTLLMLDEIAAASSTLKLPENRVFILNSAANLIWQRDQKRARTLFWEAINTLNVASAKSSTNDDPAKYFETFERRREILNTAARRDAQLALELLHASRQTPPESVDPAWLNTERDLEQQIAAVAAENDPTRALQLARDSLAKGLSLQIISLLTNLNQKDAELGTKFASEVIDKIQTVGINNDLNAYIAIFLLSGSRKIADNGEHFRLATTSSAPAYKNLELPKEERRELTEMLANAALSATSSPALLRIITGVMAEIEEFVPERVLMLKRKLAESDRSLPQTEKDQRHFNSLVTNGSPEEILKASLKLTDEQRYWLEREAILSAVFSKKSDAFRDFIMKEVDDESRRKRLLDSLDTQEIGLATQRGDSGQLRKLLPKIRLKEQRARAMAEIAMLLETQGKHDEALSLLDEAQSLIKTDLQSETKSNALLSLMLAYALIEPARAFAIAEHTIDKANDEISKLLLFDKLFKSGFFKKGEIVLGHSGMIHPDFALLKYGRGVSALARADFSRTRAAADRFERHELRILARLLIAQAVLNPDQYTGSRVVPIGATSQQ